MRIIVRPLQLPMQPLSLCLLLCPLLGGRCFSCTLLLQFSAGLSPWFRVCKGANALRVWSVITEEIEKGQRTDSTTPWSCVRRPVIWDGSEVSEVMMGKSLVISSGCMDVFLCLW